jgi:hypothetical protein
METDTIVTSPSGMSEWTVVVKLVRPVPVAVAGSTGWLR